MTAQLREGCIPGGLSVDSSGDRRVLLVFSSGRAITTGEGEYFSLAPDGADLSFLRSGRAPLLADHRHEISAVLGVIEAAWVHDGAVVAIARFGTTPAATEAWQGVASGVLRNVSCGYRFNSRDVVDLTGRRFRVWRWRPFEISLVAIPADADAHVSRVEHTFGELAALAISKGEDFEAEAVLARETALQLPEWKAWAKAAAEPLAAMMPCPPPDLADQLARLVAAHFDKQGTK